MTNTPPPSRRRSGRRVLPGIATDVPPAEPSGQRGLFAEPGEPVPRRERREVLPGVVHVPGWLAAAAQRELAREFRRWALPPAGLRHPRMPTGHAMSVQSVCLGWHWRPYIYSKTADDTDGAPVKPLPPELAALGRAAVAAAYGAESAAARSFAPDAAIVNLYAPGARLGIHQDAEEPSEAPVVTVSLGDACVFRLASVERRTGPFLDLTFASGDLIVFGGPNRRIHHGVPRLWTGTAPEGLGLPPGRLSITLRETGLPAPPGSPSSGAALVTSAAHRPRGVF